MSLPHGFQGPLQERPNAIALSDEQGSCTWAELAQQVEELHATLERVGVLPGQRVLIPSRPPAAAARAVWAVLARGAHAVPIDPALPSAEARRRATAVGARFVLDVDGLRPLEPAAAPSSHGSHLPDAAALLVFTSGTTGSARAVVLSLPALVASADGVVAGADLRAGDVWLDPLPLSHVGGLGVLFRGARVGAETRLVDAFDPAAVARLLAGGAVSHASFVARMVDRLLPFLESENLRASRLRCALVGGGRTDPELLRRARARGLPAVSTYGLSEAGSTVTLQRPTETVGAEGDAGWPVPGRLLRIGPDDEVQVGGPSLMTGYDDGPPLDGWLPTGDRGRLLADGRLMVLDRRSDLVVTGGENVSPTEVEGLLRGVPDLLEVCVLGLPHPSWGQELIAVAVWRGAAGPEVAQEALKAMAPWQRPRRWIQRRDPLPRNALGKLLREQLRQELMDSGER